MCARFEAIEVALEFEDTTVVNTDTLEDSVAVEQSMVINRDDCVLLINEMTVEPNLHEASREARSVATAGESFGAPPAPTAIFGRFRARSRKCLEANR
jgi:hypothetical protein